MNNQIEIFKEPLEIKKKLSANYSAEMSEWQSGFLCGLIKKYRPKKIVEVGIAAGGTTAILLNCISMLELNAEVYSIDLSEKYYLDKSKRTGYLAEECKCFLQKDISHKMYLGGVLPEFIDEIGKEIDFLILDTVHYMPGEILDFLACFPNLKDGAIVALHDIILNHSGKRVAEAFATKVLFSTVVGEKIVCKEDKRPYKYPNIGAFMITQDTRKYIENVFFALTITWNYIPEIKHLDLYRKCYSKYYSDDLCEEFNNAINLNQDSIKVRMDNFKKEFQDIKEFTESLREKKNIWIYGCGKLGKKACIMLEYFGIKSQGYVISNNQIKPCLGNRKVEYLSDIDDEKCTFILAMNLANQKEICMNDIKGECICINNHIIEALHRFT